MKNEQKKILANGKLPVSAVFIVTSCHVIAIVVVMN